MNAIELIVSKLKEIQYSRLWLIGTKCQEQEELMLINLILIIGTAVLS